MNSKFIIASVLACMFVGLVIEATQLKGDEVCKNEQIYTDGCKTCCRSNNNMMMDYSANEGSPCTCKIGLTYPEGADCGKSEESCDKCCSKLEMFGMFDSTQKEGFECACDDDDDIFA